MNPPPAQPEDYQGLYRRAFAEFRAHALWNKRELPAPTPEDALVVARALRIEGNRQARLLVERIERACRAAVSYTAEVSKRDDSTRLEWVGDSDHRFFPTVPDEFFGYILHPVDLAINKVMAAAARREVRDIIDLVTIDATILPLGALVWAAVEKSPGFTPEGLIAEIRRNMHYPAADWRVVQSSEPLDPKAVCAYLRAALDGAETFIARMPTDRIGVLFLKGAEVVQPDPDRLQDYATHAGQRHGHWPSSPDIAAAMLGRYRAAPAAR